MLCLIKCISSYYLFLHIFQSRFLWRFFLLGLFWSLSFCIVFLLSWSVLFLSSFVFIVIHSCFGVGFFLINISSAILFNIQPRVPQGDLSLISVYLPYSINNVVEILNNALLSAFNKFVLSPIFVLPKFPWSPKN